MTRAAQALGQSQPTVSIWLAKVRQQLGDPLFVRTAGGMPPTPRADALIDTVREVLACPLAIPGFTVKQYWHARYHHDAANRWLRGVCADLFLESG